MHGDRYRRNLLVAKIFVRYSKPHSELRAGNGNRTLYPYSYVSMHCNVAFLSWSLLGSLPFAAFLIAMLHLQKYALFLIKTKSKDYQYHFCL